MRSVARWLMMLECEGGVPALELGGEVVVQDSSAEQQEMVLWESNPSAAATHDASSHVARLR